MEFGMGQRDPEPQFPYLPLPIKLSRIYGWKNSGGNIGCLGKGAEYRSCKYLDIGHGSCR